uniref:Plastid lipid-associated protein/fibrillin conserved domain-containing protein n=1 Tax=Oryza nivara TaxID=4536 RepID=A0A0E0I8T6_ORYNI
MAAAVASSCCASTSARPLVRRAGSRSGKLWWAGGGRKARLLSISATAAAPSGVDYAAGTGAAADDDAVAALKVKLLSAVSGLNRGLAASQEDLDRADAAARELEAAAGGGPVDLEGDMDKLQGRWRLVFQRIDVVSKDFDNIVDVELGAPWPLPPVELMSTLAHKFEIIGTSSIKITFDKTTVKTKGNLSQLPPLEVPRIPDNLRPPSNTGSGEFEVTYLDGDTRITRGDRGELRVFVIS